MPRKDVYEYQREIRTILLAAHADGWAMKSVADGALGEAEITLANAERDLPDDLPTYRSEDGATLKQGQRAYDYYTMEPGTIGKPNGSDGWFDFHHDRGTRELLNGQRICTLAFAKRRGFKGA